MAIGVLESLAAGYLDPIAGAGLSSISSYFVLLAMLSVRPHGMFGRPSSGYDAPSRPLTRIPRRRTILAIMSSPTEAPRPKAVLVGVQLSGVTDAEQRSSLTELKRLCETLGFEVVAQLTQRRDALDPGAVLGTGKRLRSIPVWLRPVTFRNQLCPKIG